MQSFEYNMNSVQKQNSVCVEGTSSVLNEKVKRRSLWEKIIKYQDYNHSLFYIALLGYMNFPSHCSWFWCVFPFLCLLKSPLLPSNSPRLIILRPNGGDVDKAKSDIKQIRSDSNRFASISSPKVKLGPYDPSQQILVSIIFILSKLHLLHIFPTRGLITCQTVLPSHLRVYKIELLFSAVKQLSPDTSLQ